MNKKRVLKDTSSITRAKKQNKQTNEQSEVSGRFHKHYVLQLPLNQLKTLWLSNHFWTLLTILKLAIATLGPTFVTKWIYFKQ